MPQCSLAECRHCRRRGLIEVAAGHCRIGISLAGQEASDVATIFAEERAGVIFRVALEEEKQAPSALDEQISTGLG